MNEQVQAVNDLLQAGEPGNIKEDTHKNPPQSGYRPQSVIDALNEALWGAWGFEEVSSEIVPGEKGAIAVAQVRVWLAGVEFRPVGWGQGRVTSGDIGDARKSAQTDAIKKALSYFSIGNRAHLGLLDAKKAGSNGTSGNQQRSQESAKNGDTPLSQDQTVLNECKRIAKEKGIARNGAEWLRYLEVTFKAITTDADLLASPVKLASLRGEVLRAKALV